MEQTPKKTRTEQRAKRSGIVEKWDVKNVKHIELMREFISCENYDFDEISYGEMKRLEFEFEYDM